MKCVSMAQFHSNISTLPHCCRYARKTEEINENIWRAMNGIFKGQQKEFSLFNSKTKSELNETYFFANASNKFSLSYSYFTFFVSPFK